MQQLTAAPRIVIALLLSLALLAAGWGDDSSEPEGNDAGGAAATAEPTTEGDDSAGEAVTITATDYKFDLAGSYDAGNYTFTLANAGKERHFIDIIELKADAPPVTKLIKIKEADKFFVRPVGGTKPVQPGEQSEPFEVELTPGRYGYVCFIETKDGKPHAFLGMAGEFSVE